MKASSLKDATAATIAPPKSEVHADTTGRIYFFPNAQATAASNLYRARWDSSKHIEEFQMLAKIRQLPPDLQAEHEAALDALVEKAKNRRNDAFMATMSGLSDESFSRFWDNPKDAEYDDL